MVVLANLDHPGHGGLRGICGCGGRGRYGHNDEVILSRPIPERHSTRVLPELLDSLWRVLWRDELVEVAQEVPNIAAKHEGGDPEVDAAREHPSDILDYFLTKEEILSQGLMGVMERNYLDKHDAVNRTAEALIKAGIGVVCAWNLHK